MLKILVASPDGDGLHDFTAALAQAGEAVVERVSTAEAVLARAGSDPPHLVVIDQGLADSQPLDLVSSLLRVNAMINTAVVSDMPEEDFHEASEGLGIMASLTPDADAARAAEVMAKLKSLTGL